MWVCEEKSSQRAPDFSPTWDKCHRFRVTLGVYLLGSTYQVLDRSDLLSKISQIATVLSPKKLRMLSCIRCFLSILESSLFHWTHISQCSRSPAISLPGAIHSAYKLVRPEAQVEEILGLVVFPWMSISSSLQMSALFLFKMVTSFQEECD